MISANRSIRTAAIMLVLVAGSSWATDTYMDRFISRYPAVVGTRIDSCGICHPGMKGEKISLTSYGSAYKNNSRDFATIEPFDSDGDGYSNLIEINNLSFPGNGSDKPVDTTKPVITLTGSSPMTVECHSTFTDPGATASDNVEGNITSKIIKTGTVNANAPGAYTITYNVSDIAGNAAMPVSRTVNVTDTVAPVITRLGNAAVTVACGGTYTDAGATASDTCGGNLTGSIVTNNPVDMSIPDSYTVTYNVVDASGNPAAQVTRTVNVIDTTPPMITLLGGASVETACKSSYLDAGATASDLCEGDLSNAIQVDNGVNTAVPGVYHVTYMVSDSAGNPAVPVSRTVTVDDVVPPVVTLLGNAEVTLECKQPYTDAGATASDDCNGNLDASVEVSGSVDVNSVGDYTLTYTVSDAAGNPAVPVSRAVHVKDTTPPAITLTGPAARTVDCGTEYVDQGVTANDACNGDLTDSILRTGNVDTSTPGEYGLTYTVSDLTGNAAVPVIRTVLVEGPGCLSSEGEGAVEGGEEGVSEGALEGEGGAEGVPEGALEGEGGAEGVTEGAVEGEGTAEGLPEGVQEGEGAVEGVTEGTVEGEGVSEGVEEGTAEGVIEGEGDPEGMVENPHSADQNADGRISLSELLRLIQFYNSGGYHCDASGEDGFAPGTGDQSCVPHNADYISEDWAISLSELLRMIQFYNSGGYHTCDEGEDGFCPGRA